jgi:hypothetical protein
VASLFDHVDRHYNHGDGTYPLAHHPVTNFYVSGLVRFPLDLRFYVEVHGNVAADAFLYGMAAQELRQEELDFCGHDYEIMAHV